MSLVENRQTLPLRQ